MATRKRAHRPTSLILRTYQVGFGDCFLLTFKYPNDRDRNILIDFGTVAQPKTAPKDLMMEIATDIAHECGGKLDALVLTHRHKDHISGFTPAADHQGTGDIIAGLHPDLVVQPWTEDPKAKPDATRPTTTHTPNEQFALSLEYMHDVSAGVHAEALRLAAGEPLPARRAMYAELAALGEEGIQNRPAVDNLMKMGKRHGAHAEYVNHGYVSKLAQILPGVKVTVLGPPTLDQSNAIRKERSADANEFWMLQSNSGRFVSEVANAAETTALFPKAAMLERGMPPQYARWLIPKLRAIRASALLGIVRVLDDAMNNTSVILLFEVNKSALLFPGDAQIENWQYTLDKLATDADLKTRLADVTLYKVGHHGSRNATPKTLWNNFQHRGPRTQPDRLRTFVSTLENVYGKTEATEVPRATLLRALRAQSTFFTTQSIRQGIKRQEEIPL